ncbi:ROK family glucokinase [Aeromicrobium sp.]|uniref:ROK family glucokinase n=1 Tax=Aeromicrobium sp. TaxID=1871063 RepID=UPI003D6A357B
MSKELAIGIDIGGTKIAAGVVDEDGRVLARERADTPGTDPAAVLETIGGMVDRLQQEHRIVALGIGAAGFIDASGSTVLFAPHLAWRNEMLQETASRRTGLPVHVENDANASGWAEWRFGAARNDPDVVMVTLGTGIGGGILIDGQPYRGRYGVAGEFGHMQVVPDGLPCECGNQGCWEQYASGRVLTRLGRRAAEARTELGGRLLEAAGGAAEDIHGSHVVAAARSGDAEAITWMTEIGDWLGVGLANLAAALDPGVLVVGGGVSDAGELLLGPARSAFSRTLTGRGYRTEARIVTAHLGPEAGLIGAADLARRSARLRS